MRLPLNLPMTSLFTIITYCDIGALPTALVLNKSWYSAYKRNEQYLWFQLIKHYHPTTVNLIRSLTLGKMLNNITDSKPPSSTIPLPSIDWKQQYKRRYVLLQNVRSNIDVIMPSPSTLSDFAFQVDLIMPCGIVFTTIRDPLFESCVYFHLNELRIDLSPLQLQIRNYYEKAIISKPATLTTREEFCINITVTRRRDAKQALLYRGNPEDWCDESDMLYQIVCPPHSYFSTYVCILNLVAFRRCAFNSLCDQSSFYRIPTRDSNNCCECAIKWSCFHNYEARLTIFDNIEHDIEINVETFLIYLDKGLHFV